MIFGTHDENTLEQYATIAAQAERAALMADGHLGYIMPIGGVAAYRNQISPVGVGFDIACGNAAIQTDLKAADILPHLDEIADQIARTISFGMGLSNNEPDAPRDNAVFDRAAWSIIPKEHRASLRDTARNQLGTTGGGNHYVDVFADEQEQVWVGVHFGSRGFGHKIAGAFLALAQGEPWGTRVQEKECLLSLDDQMGQDYWDLMELAGRYAHVGRMWVVRKVVSILGGTAAVLVHNHHNYAWRENHYGREYIVIRKGATPAFPMQYGFVGGSMGDDSVILRGTLCKSVRQQSALYSTVHGAGRVMSRTQAKGKWKKGVQKKPGLISQGDMDGWLKARGGVVLRGGDLDEAPQAYRRLTDVLAAQGDTIEVVHTLKPLIVCMAPRNTRR